MSLIFCDGFEDGLSSLGKWNLAYGSNVSIGNPGVPLRNGSALTLGDTGNGLVKRQFTSTEEHATLTVGLAFRAFISYNFDQSNFTYEGQLAFQSDAGTTTHITVIMAGGGSNTSPRIDIYRGNLQGTLLGSTPVAPWVAGQWYYLEAQVTLADSGGSVITKLNGATVNNITGVDTKNGGTKTVLDSIKLQNSQQISNNWNVYVNDLYVTNGAGSVNTGFLGDIAVETLYPSGDGSTNQFVGSDGNSASNYALVNEAGAPNLTNYTEDGLSTDRDLYAYDNLTRTSGTIYGVQIASYAQKQDSGTRSLKNVTKSSVVSAASTTLSLVTTYRSLLSVQEVDPNTTTAWSIAGVNAAEFGIEVA